MSFETGPVILADGKKLRIAGQATRDAVMMVGKSNLDKSYQVAHRHYPIYVVRERVLVRKWLPVYLMPC